MEKIPTELLSLSPLVLVALFFIYQYFKYGQKKKNGNNGNTEILQKIQGNDLAHIKTVLETQNSILAHQTTQHEQQIILLTKIATTLDLKLK